MARPKTTKYSVGSMVRKVNKYVRDCIDKNELPILKDCCFINEWNYDYVMQLKRNEERKEVEGNDHDGELTHSIKRLLDLKEIMLERGGLNGDFDKTFAIFSIKQLGWTDKQEIETTGAINNNIESIKQVLLNPVINRELPGENNE